jgi:hypothetical protein
MRHRNSVTVSLNIVAMYVVPKRRAFTASILLKDEVLERGAPGSSFSRNDRGGCWSQKQ